MERWGQGEVDENLLRDKDYNMYVSQPIRVR